MLGVDRCRSLADPRDRRNKINFDAEIDQSSEAFIEAHVTEAELSVLDDNGFLVSIEAHSAILVTEFNHMFVDEHFLDRVVFAKIENTPIHKCSAI